MPQMPVVFFPGLLRHHVLFVEREIEAWSGRTVFGATYTKKTVFYP